MPVMCIGYTKIQRNEYLALKEKIKSLKLQYKTPTEIKWNTLSLSRLDFYKALVDLFFENDIDFRCILIKNKQKLDHKEFNQGDHNNFYYKSVYLLLKNSHTNTPCNEYYVMLDIKDTQGRDRLRKMEEVFCNQYNGKSPFVSFQHIHSHENEFIQLTDFFIGAITYTARGEHKKTNASKVKVDIINYIEQKSGYHLDEGTEPWEQKFNIFDFQPKSPIR
jgi:hypothetical protein